MSAEMVSTTVFSYSSHFVVICSKTKFWILFKFDKGFFSCFTSTRLNNMDFRLHILQFLIVCIFIFAGKRSRQHILKFNNETLRKGRKQKNVNVYNCLCSCMWICFNIYLFIIYLIFCTVSYTMRWTRVPIDGARSTKL